MVPDVWHEAVVPQAALLSCKTGNELIQDGWSEGHLLGLQRMIILLGQMIS
jgi:hypothetical protein